MWFHRWTALILGVLLVVVSTSGALVVYAPELLRASNAELFRSTPTERPIDFTAAIEAIQESEPEFDPAEISLKDGVFMLTGAESELTYFVEAEQARSTEAETSTAGWSASSRTSTTAG